MRKWAAALSRALVPVTVAGVVLAASAAPAAAGTDDTDGSSLTATCATFGQGTTGAAVKTIQTLVDTPADGDFGPQTAAALKAWAAA